MRLLRPWRWAVALLSLRLASDGGYGSPGALVAGVVLLLVAVALIVAVDRAR